MEDQIVDNNPKKVSAGRVARIVFFVSGFAVFVLGVILLISLYPDISGSKEGGIAVGIFVMISAVITIIGFAVMALAYFWHRSGDKSRHWIRNFVLVFIILLVIGWLLWFIFHPRPVVSIPSF